VSAETIIFCRYDFYPELLLFGLNKNLILISAASKKMSWFKSSAFRCFDYIIAANKIELDFFKQKFPLIKSDSFDFRIPQIFKRIGQKNEKLNQHKDLAAYLNFLGNHPRESMLILGSAWLSDLVIFEDSQFWRNKLDQENFHLLIVPHSLDEANTNSIKEKLDSIFGAGVVAHISEHSLRNDHTLAQSPPPVVLLNWRGILCELYTYFNYAYVGGGLERSIHSVLEPFLAGSKVLVSGVVTRSAEYDFLKSIAPNEICLLKNGQSFYNLFNEAVLSLPDQDLRSQLEQEASLSMVKVINEITNVK